MGMKIGLILLFFILAFSSSCYAAGNLTVIPFSLAPPYINTNVSTDMINLTLNATDNLNLIWINVSVIGISAGNVSFIEIKNSSGSVINYSSVNENTNSSLIYINDFNVTSSENKTLIVSIILKSDATLLSSFLINISSSGIGVDSGSNVSITGGYAQSGSSQIQDVHARARITPLFVDTSVVNQSIVYIIEPVGRNRFSNISIIVPIQYYILNVTEVKQGSNVLYNSTTSIASVLFSSSTGEINITNTAADGFGLYETIIVNISVNTSSYYVAGMPFNSSISGSNLSALTYVYGANTTVTTKQLLNVTSISVTKSAAIANGTDYWEFNLTINFSESVSGSINFKLSNWTNGAGNYIPLQNATTGNIRYYSSLRDALNSSRIVNITNEYNASNGLSIQGCCTAGTLYTIILRMIIPAGTPSFSSWSSTYSILFRSL